MTKMWIRRVDAPAIGGTRSEYILRLLPYGCYHCADGREVLFDRDYAPICERRPGQSAKRSDPGEWIKNIVLKEWFYVSNDPSVANAPKHKRRPIAEAKLREWGEDMYASVMAEVDELASKSGYFSWRRGTWVFPKGTVTELTPEEFAVYLRENRAENPPEPRPDPLIRRPRWADE